MEETTVDYALGPGAAGPAEKLQRKLRRRYPTVAYLRARTLPGFAFEYMDGGAGADGAALRVTGAPSTPSS